jgi:hypothetical protein
MKKSPFVFALLLLMVLALPGSAWTASSGASAASSKGGRIETQERETIETFGPLLTDTAVPVAKGVLYLQPFWSWSLVTGAFSNHGRRVSAGGNFYAGEFDLQIYYGLWDNFEVFTVIPVVVNWADSVELPGPGGERSASHGGLSDINLTLKYRLVKEGPRAPTITALFATDFPTGQYKNLDPALLGTDALGAGAYVFTTGLNLSKWIKPFIFYANLYYSMSTSFTDDEGKKHPRDFVTLNLAAEYPLTRKWIALLEFTSFWDGGRLFGPRANVAPIHLLSVLPGIEFMATKKMAFYLGMSVDLIGRNTDARVMPIFSLVWMVN